MRTPLWPKAFLCLILIVSVFSAVPASTWSQVPTSGDLKQNLESLSAGSTDWGLLSGLSKAATESSGGSLASILSSESCVAGMAGPYPCDQIDLLSFLPLETFGEQNANDIWGWTDPETGREYALLGLRDGTAFIDVTDPRAPDYLGRLDTHTIASSWRDMKVFANHVFIVADNASSHGMQVFDLTRLRNVVGAPVTFSETAHYGQIASAHNIAINEQTGIGYIVGSQGGGTTCGGGLHMVDLNTPTAPSFAGCFMDPTTGRRLTGYTHDTQCVTYRGPDPGYQGKEICIGSNETAISIADVTDKQNPIAISTASYPSVAYAHQGWFSSGQDYFFQNDELEELTPYYACRATCADNACVNACFEQHIITAPPNTSTLVWDVSDLDDPVLANIYTHGTSSIDHNLYTKRNVMFESNYTIGLRILDISDRENPTPLASFDTYSPHDYPLFNGSWSNYPYFDSGNIIVSSIGEGLFVLKPGPDTDGDGVLDPNDMCPFTQIPEAAPTNGLKNNRWTMMDGDHWFDTAGRKNAFSFSIADTGGCSCEQIIDELGLGRGQNKFGCSGSTVASWANFVETGVQPAASKGGGFDALHSEDVPGEVTLENNYPNPFNPETVIQFGLPESGLVNLIVYDLQGREVATLVDGFRESGTYSVTFNAADLPSGVYLYQLDTANETRSGRMTLVK